MDDAELQILLSYKEEGREVLERNKIAIAEMNANLAFRDALRAAGVIGQEAEIRSTKSDTDAVQDNTKALEFSQLPMASRAMVIAALAASQSAFTQAVRDNTVATGQNAAVQQAASTAGAGGIPVWLGVTAAIAGLVVVLWPFVMLVGSAAVALISFTVAASGFLLTAGLVAGAFGAIGAAVLLLGGGAGAGTAAALTKATDQLTNAQEALVEFDQEHTKHLTILQQHQREQLVENIAKAQAKYADALVASQGPMAVLVGKLGEMKDTLAEQAAPLANLITIWLGGYIPAITQVGQSIMSWFGDRLPGVLYGLGKVFYDLAPAFQSFGQYFGGVMDKIGPLIAPIAEGFARLALQGARGLLDNLVRLSEWFVKELPTLGPIVQQIFGQIGNMIQWVADHWSTLNDFVVNKWPATVKQVQDDLKSLNEWWQQNGGTIQTFAGHVVDLMGAFNNIIGPWTKLYDFMNGIGLTPTALLSALNEVATLLAEISGYIDYINGSNRGGGNPAGVSPHRSTQHAPPPPPAAVRGRGFIAGQAI